MKNLSETGRDDQLEPIQPPSEPKEPKERIIPYTDEYREGIIKFFQQIAEEYPEKQKENPDDYAPKIQTEDINSNFWVAVGVGKEVIGTMGLKDCGNRIGYMGKLYVQKGLRGKGVGSEIFKKAVDFAKEKGYKTLFGATMPSNDKARKLYDKLGMKIVDTPPATSMTFHEGTVFVQIDLEKEQK